MRPDIAEVGAGGDGGEEEAAVAAERGREGEVGGGQACVCRRREGLGLREDLGGWEVQGETGGGRDEGEGEGGEEEGEWVAHCGGWW